MGWPGKFGLYLSIAAVAVTVVVIIGVLINLYFRMILAFA